MVGDTIGSNVFNQKPERAIEAAPEKIIDNKLKNLNIESADLHKEIPDFNRLSPGQKFLALENLEQSILGEIKEDALENYRGRFSKMTGKEEGVSRFNLHNAGVLGQNLWLGITKQYQLAKIEKAKSEELLSGGLELHKEVLTKLTEGLKNYGPEAELDKENKLQINYLQKPEGLSAEEEKLIDSFNHTATALSGIPDEWRYDTAKETEKRKFTQANKLYEKDKAIALNILQEKIGGEGKAALEMNKIDSQIRLNQFLNSNPEVETQLLKIKDQSLIKRTLSGVIAERGLYMGAGYASRTFATLGLGALGAAASFGGVVAGAGIIGYFKASSRAKETIRQKDSMGRRGQKDNGELAKIFAPGGSKQKSKFNEETEISFGLGEKINYLVTRLEEETDESRKTDLANRLQTRLEYTKKYLDNGAVDFGTKEERLSNQYSLLTGMAQAETYLDLADKNNQQRQTVEAKIKEKIYNPLDQHDQKIDQKRKEYVIKQARKGMMIAMGFATAGRIFNELIHSQGEALDSKQPSAIRTEKIINEPISTSPNNPDSISYLTSDPILKNNLDLKASLLDQKVTVNVLAKGQSIGTYANVTNHTPVNFVQADGSVEVHGAGEVYVHPGDRVIQTEDGQIYVIKDSGLKGGQTESYLASHEPINNGAVENPKTASYLETHKAEVETAKSASYLNQPATKPETHQGLFSKVRDFITGKKIDNQEAASAGIPSSFSKEGSLNEKLISQWNSLDKADQEIYQDFSANTSLYKTDPESAIIKFLGQTPADINPDSESTEILVALNNGHMLVFDTDNGQIVISVDNGPYKALSPEQIINARKAIQSNYSTPEQIKEIPTETNLDKPAINNEILDKADQEIYRDFSANASLYKTKPELAIVKFLGQEPADINPDPESTEIPVVLKNGRMLVFDTDNGQIVVSVDNGPYKTLDPEQVIATRKIIQSNYSAPKQIKEMPTEIKTSPASPEIVKDVDSDSDMWEARPDIEKLKFNQADFNSAQEAQIQAYYNKRLEVLEEIKKQYANIREKYSDNPQFNHFQKVIRTYYTVENEKVKNIIAGVEEPENLNPVFYRELKEIQNPKKEVNSYMQRIISQTVLKKEKK